MKIWQPLSDEELARAEARLRHPAPGRKIEAAQRYGVDLTLLISHCASLLRNESSVRWTPPRRLRPSGARRDASK